MQILAYMKTKGHDPKEQGLLNELDRVKEAMGRAKQISDKALAPKLDVSAARRFIRGGLWENKEQDTNKEDSPDSTQTAEDDTGPSTAKRMKMECCDSSQTNVSPKN